MKVIININNVVKEFADQILANADKWGNDELFLAGVDTNSVLHAVRRRGDGKRYELVFDDGVTTWTLKADSKTLRKIATGSHRTVEVEITSWESLRARKRVGDAFAVWGTAPTQRCVLRSSEETAACLQLLRDRNSGSVLGSPYGDLAFVAFCSDGVFAAMTLDVAKSGGLAEVSTEGNEAETEPCPASLPSLVDPLPLLFADYAPFELVLKTIVDVVSEGVLPRDIARAALGHPRQLTGAWRGGVRWPLEDDLRNLRKRLVEQRVEATSAASFGPFRV